MLQLVSVVSGVGCCKIIVPAMHAESKVLDDGMCRCCCLGGRVDEDATTHEAWGATECGHCRVQMRVMAVQSLCGVSRMCCWQLGPGQSWFIWSTYFRVCLTSQWRQLSRAYYYPSTPMQHSRRTPSLKAVHPTTILRTMKPENERCSSSCRPCAWMESTSIWLLRSIHMPHLVDRHREALECVTATYGTSKRMPARLLGLWYLMNDNCSEALDLSLSNCSLTDDPAAVLALLCQQAYGRKGHAKLTAFIHDHATSMCISHDVQQARTKHARNTT